MTNWHTLNPRKPLANPKFSKTDNVTMAISDYGYCEIGKKTHHFKFKFPHDEKLYKKLNVACGFSFVDGGEDVWIPKDSSIVNVKRQIMEWKEGWEYRREDTNGRIYEYWWVPHETLEAFALFLKDHHSK